MEKHKEYHLFISNKRCLGCGGYLLYSKDVDQFKCFSTGENKKCQIITRQEIEFNTLYGKDRIDLRPLK